MHCRRAAVALAVVALAACSDQSAQPKPRDVRAMFANLTMRDIANPHNFVVGQVGALLRKGVDRSAPVAVQLATMEAIVTRYFGDEIGDRNAASEVDSAFNAQIWRQGPTGKFWGLRTGTPPRSGPARGPFVDDDPLSAQAQAYEVQIVSIAADSSGASVATVRSSLQSVEQSATQTLADSEAAYIVGFATLTDSSVVYWKAQVDSVNAGLDPAYGSLLEPERAPPSRSWAAGVPMRSILSIWGHLWNAVRGDAAGSIVGALGCALSPCRLGGWVSVGYAAAVAGVLGSIIGAALPVN